MIKQRALFFILLIQSLVSASVYALDSHSVTVKGRERVTVSNELVFLNDLADITSARIADDEAILALSKIEIARAPEPGATLSISAHQIIDLLKNAGVALSQVGYTFPRVVTVKRASRIIQQSEVKQAIENFLSQSNEQATVRAVSFINEPQVAPDAELTKISPLPSKDIQRPQFSLTFTSAQRPPVQLSVSATVDRWIEVAIMRRPIERGEVVTGSDVAMARFNVQSIPADAIGDISKVLGLESKRRLSAGDVLQRDTFAIPTLIRSGEKVTIKYRSNLIEATATGIALDGAGLEQPIRVKNDVSSKVVSGFVKASGLVEVK
jgi:flagella basal body P-ring formation protein FlgA